MDWTYSMKKIRNAYRIVFGNLKERVYLEYLGVDGRSELNWQRIQTPTVTFQSRLA
jgi:hypothetical protein